MKIANVKEIMATRARATFSHRINFHEVGYLTMPKMKEWCEANCTGIWGYHSTHALYFQFSEERDATMFMLRWGAAEGNKLK